MSRVFIRGGQGGDIAEVRECFERSRLMHQPWMFPPKNFFDYLTQEHRYFVCLKQTNAIIGSFHISGIIRGSFQSAYLGYEGFLPYSGQGYMTEGIHLVLEEAFAVLGLHRLEANIQPGNTASLKLVSRAGFVKEGFSKQYLNIGGVWQDHERWAVINKHWLE